MVEVAVREGLSPEEVAEVLATVERAESVEGRTSLDDADRLELLGAHPGLVALVARPPGTGDLAGYAQLVPRDGAWALSLVLDPAHRDRTGDLAVELVRRALAEAVARGGGEVHLWLHDPEPADTDVATRAGLRPWRELLQLRRPLPLGEAEASLARAPTRPFRMGEDEAEVLEVNNAAFAGHPEQGDWDLAAIRARERADWFDPADFLLLEEAGGLGGFCWTKIHRDPATGRGALGEIYVIATAPRLQGRGLGRALLCSGLDHLHARGVATAMLYVDAENAPARHLYASLEFALDHADRAFRSGARR